ncbi:MAG: SIMPL domain-containing protein [Firmicutes bacterium]|nr:SIMPL domain-containing protein [Bacillota bacterium]
MNRLRTISLNIVILLVLCLGSTQAAVISEQTSRLQVVGQAVIKVAPDTATISLGVETSNVSAEQAATENAEIMARVMDALRNMGLTTTHISTSGYNIYSYVDTFNRTGDEQGLATYQVYNGITITTQNLDQVGQIVDVAVQAGVNQVQGVSFDLADKQELQLQALKAAINQAQIKAQAMAEAAGTKLGGIISINEEQVSYLPYTESAFLKASTVIVPEEIEVTAQVNMVFWF